MLKQQQNNLRGAVQEVQYGVLTSFLRRSGEASFDSAAVRIVSTTNPTFVLDFVRANFSVTANFLETKKTTTQMNRDRFLAEGANSYFHNVI